MNFLIDNWYLVLAAVAVIIFIVVITLKWFSLPTATQIANIKEWLKWAVTEAEKELGSGTGQLKLRMVYDMAVANFDWIAKYVSFETFSTWVDDALEWLKTQLESNNSLKMMVEKDK